jgi:hypothetical protein
MPKACPDVQEWIRKAMEEPDTLTELEGEF